MNKNIKYISMFSVLAIIVVIIIFALTASGANMAKGTYATPPTYGASSAIHCAYLCNTNDGVSFNVSGVAYCCEATWSQLSGTRCWRYTNLYGTQYKDAYKANYSCMAICSNSPVHDEKYCCESSSDNFLYVDGTPTCCQGTVSECNALNCQKINRGSGCYSCNGSKAYYSTDPDYGKCVGKGSCTREGDTCSSPQCTMTNRKAGCYICNGNTEYYDYDPDFIANICDSNRVCTRKGNTCVTNEATEPPTPSSDDKSCYCNTCNNGAWESYVLRSMTQAQCANAVSACVGTNAKTSWGYADSINRCPTTNDYFTLNDYERDDTKKIIRGINRNVSKNEFKNKIESSGTVTILDKDTNIIDDERKMCTGYILRVVFESDIDHPIDYRLSIKGDVLGTGELSMDNSKFIARHIIDKNVISGDEYLMAADYDGDGVIKMTDVIKILREME